MGGCSRPTSSSVQGTALQEPSSKYVWPVLPVFDQDWKTIFFFFAASAYSEHLL